MPPLAKRFYRTVTIGGASPSVLVLLDGGPIRTPAKRELAVASRALAEAIAAEWAAQGQQIDPASMPLTRLVNTAIDGVAGREAEVRADIVSYAGADMLCYRTADGGELARRQRSAWDPILTWGKEALGVRLVVVEGIMPAAQPEAARAAVARALDCYDAFSLAALHAMTTLTGSALLALAHARGHLSTDDAWAAAHVDEDWQIEKWGEDGEANVRRNRRWAEMQAAGRLLACTAGRT